MSGLKKSGEWTNEAQRIVDKFLDNPPDKVDPLKLKGSQLKKLLPELSGYEASCVQLKVHGTAKKRSKKPVPMELGGGKKRSRFIDDEAEEDGDGERERDEEEEPIFQKRRTSTVNTAASLEPELDDSPKSKFLAPEAYTLLNIRSQRFDSNVRLHELYRYKDEKGNLQVNVFLKMIADHEIDYKIEKNGTIFTATYTSSKNKRAAAYADNDFTLDCDKNEFVEPVDTKCVNKRTLARKGIANKTDGGTVEILVPFATAYTFDIAAQKRRQSDVQFGLV
ncbi:hypothetical protein HDU76_001455, partial [Blyttiomyces sp. JEL0837]